MDNVATLCRVRVWDDFMEEMNLGEVWVSIGRGFRLQQWHEVSKGKLHGGRVEQTSKAWLIIL